jgi:hypothetical protein
MARLLRYPSVEFFQHRTDISLTPVQHRPEQHSTGNAKKLPPMLTSGFQSIRPKGRNGETSVLKMFHGRTHRVSSFRRYRRPPIIFKPANARLLQFT